MLRRDQGVAMIRTFCRLVVFLAITGMSACLVAEESKKDSTKFEISEEEQKIIDLTNEERAKEKLPPLKANRVLFEAARKHSANMAKKREMKHELDGKNPAQRVKAAGYDYSWTGENIAMGEKWSLEGLMKGWMESKGHRENILKDKYEEIGIGAVTNPQGETYYTQVFGTLRKKR